MPKHILTFLLILTANSTAYAFCKLNIRGDNICLGKEALFRENGSGQKDYEPESFAVVEVQDMAYPKVLVKKGKQTFTVSIDQLIGAQECSAGDHICERDKVQVSDQCLKQYEKIKVERVFRNEMFEGRYKTFPIFGATKKFVLPVDCVDQVIN